MPNIFLQKTSSSIGVPQKQIIYVGKHGSNSNDGKTPNTAVLTFAHAIELASLQSPSSSKRFSIVCLDAGKYIGNLIVPEWVDIDAPNAIIEGQVTLADNSRIKLYKVQSSTNGLVKESGSAITHVEVDEIDIKGAGGLVFGLSNGSMDGSIIAKIGKIICSSVWSIAIFASNAGAGNGYIDYQVGDIYLNSNTSFGVVGVTNARLYGKVNQIILAGSYANTFGMYASNSSVIHIVCQRIMTNTAIYVDASSVCTAIVNELTGTISELGILRLIEAKNSHTPVFKELSADPVDPEEGQAIMWMSDGTDSGDAGDIMVKITKSSVTKIGTLIDFSSL